jgi:hypothetical protein
MIDYWQERNKMFGRKRDITTSSCACRQKCPCHYSIDKKLWGMVMFFIIMVMIYNLPYFFNQHLQPQKHILVNGQDCLVQYVFDGCGSTGNCWGHDEAICPK